MRTLMTFLAWLGLSLAINPAQAAPVELQERLDTAADVLTQITKIPEDGIPPSLLKNAQGIAVIPGVIKAGFFVGGSYGKGVLTVRDESGHWGPPTFIKLAAGSLGWQFGAQSTDVVLVFKTRRSIDGIVKGTFTLGGDAAIAAGPVGRRGEAATDAELKAEILSYSRSRGLFAGISLEGSKLDIDYDANAELYGKDARPGQILDGAAGSPPAVRHFLEVVDKAMAK